MGKRAPMGPTPMVWIRVETPATKSATWIRKIVSPVAAPITPAMMMGGVTLPANIAMMCCRPRGIALESGGIASGSRLMVRVGFVSGWGAERDLVMVRLAAGVVVGAGVRVVRLAGCYHD